MTDLRSSRDIDITCFVLLIEHIFKEEPENEKHKTEERILRFPKLVGLTRRLVLEAFFWTREGPRDVGRTVRLITVGPVRVVSAPLLFRPLTIAQLVFFVIALQRISP